MQVPCAGLHHEAALEVGRDARNATQGNEEQRHLAAIAMTVVEHIFRDVVDGRILARRGPREVIVHPAEDATGLQVGIVLALCQIVSQLAQAGRENDVAVALGRVASVELRRGVVGQDVGGTNVVPLAIRGVFERFREDSGLSAHRPLLHVEGAVRRAFRSQRVRRLAGGYQLHVLLAGNVRARIGQPTTHYFARWDGIGVDGQRIGDAHALGSRQARVAPSVGSGQDFGQVLSIRAVAGTHLFAFLGQLHLTTQGVDAKKVGTRVAEVALLAIEHHALQRARLFPLAHLLVGHVGQVTADIIFHLRLRQAEISQEALVQVGLPRVGSVGRLAVASRKGQQKQDKIKQVLHTFNGKWRIENGK